MWFNSSKKEEEEIVNHFSTAVSLSATLEKLFSAFSIAERWKRGGNKDEEGNSRFLFTDCTTCCFPSPHFTCPTPPIYHAPSNKKIQLCQREHKKRSDATFFFFLLSIRFFASPFEEDSLFCVVDDDQLFILVAAERRWSSDQLSFSFFFDWLMEKRQKVLRLGNEITFYSIGMQFSKDGGGLGVCWSWR